MLRSSVPDEIYTSFVPCPSHTNLYYKFCGAEPVSLHHKYIPRQHLHIALPKRTKKEIGINYSCNVSEARFSVIQQPRAAEE